MKLEDGSTFLLDPAEKAAWIADLKSGNFKQGQGWLKITIQDGVDEYCCMGVKIQRTNPGELKLDTTGYYKFQGLHGVLPTSMLPTEVQLILTRMNDGSDHSHSKTFSQIAVWIDKNL